MSKIRIPVEQLPAPDIYGNHTLRFRVISESKNQTSAWSNLYTVKSIGQYRPYESDVVLTIGSDVISLTWDTPSIYNFSASLSSASITHNHSQNFKKHETDIFISWDGGNFQYHDKVSTDNTSAIIQGFNEVRVVGLVATHGFDTDISGADADALVADLSERFLIFDTGNVSLV